MEINEDYRRKRKRIPLFHDEPQNLAEIFLHAAKHVPREDALNYKEEGAWKSISTDEMIEAIENVALGLHQIGINFGDRAAILSANSPSWTIADAGCQFAGVVDVPIYTTLTPDSIKYILNDSGARVLFIEGRQALNRIHSIISECENLEFIVLFDGVSSKDNELSFSELIDRGNAARISNGSGIEELIKNIQSSDLATLIYTSGTTGEPKGVMLTHENLVSNVIDAGEKFRFTREDVSLSVLPLSHVFERTGMYLYIFNGMKVCYAESIEKIPENLSEIKPTIFVGVPRIFEKVYQRAKGIAASESSFKEKVFDWAIDVGKEHARCLSSGNSLSPSLAVKYSVADKLVFAKMRSFFGGRLRFCITGGAALSNSTYLIFSGAGIRIMQGYGLTETSPVISSNNPIDSLLGSVGKPIRNVEVKIASDGEILVKGPNVMLGYYNKPEETRKSFTKDGWFMTGDIGELNDDGFLRITDRKKELFKTSGGKYIAPSPIEQMIKGSRYVNQVMLVGDGEKFASALIVPDFEQLHLFLESNSLGEKTKDTICTDGRVITLFRNEVEKNCEGLASFETVKKIILIADEFTVENGELTPTLKLKRKAIMARYREKIKKLYRDVEKEKPRS